MDIMKEVKALHATKGWNGVYAFLKRHNVNYVKGVIDFGLDSNPRAIPNKTAYMAENQANEFRAHLFAQSVRAVKTGYKYNRIRAQYIRIVPVVDTREFPCDVCAEGEMIVVGTLPNCGEEYECNNCGKTQRFP